MQATKQSTRDQDNWGEPHDWFMPKWPYMQGSDLHGLPILQKLGMQPMRVYCDTSILLSQKSEGLRFSLALNRQLLTLLVG